MFRIIAAVLCLVIAVPALADEKEKKHHKLIDRKMIVAALTMVAGEIADNETTMAVLRRNHHASEANPFYGAHPSRLRMYSIGTALTGLMFLTSVAAREHSIRQGRPESKVWLVPVIMHNTARGLAAWHNSTIPARHPSVCPAAGAGCR